LKEASALSSKEAEMEERLKEEQEALAQKKYGWQLQNTAKQNHWRGNNERLTAIDPP